MKRATTKRKSKAKAAGAKAAAPVAGVDPAVAAFLRDTEHPLKAEIEAIRKIVLGVSPEIQEGIKWNAPSFRTVDHFATFNLREKDRVRLILHRGARPKGGTKTLKIADPSSLLEWLAPDRGLVTFRDRAQVTKQRKALQAILKAWINEL